MNQKVRSLGRFEDAQQLADLAGMLAEWSLVLQGRSEQVCLNGQQADIQLLNSRGGSINIYQTRHYFCLEHAVPLPRGGQFGHPLAVVLMA